MNRIALITGATSGIGEACAYKFAQNQYDLILSGRRKERLQKLKLELESEYKCNVHILIFDVRSREQVKDAIQSLSNEWKNIDVLVNNAGLAAGLDPIQSGNIDDWEQMIDTNVKGLLFISRNVIPFMIERKKGHVINIGSIAGKEIYPNGNVYCASKHAVDAITKGMRIDLLEHGIRVTQIAPGLVETEFSLVRLKDENAATQVYKGYQPLRAEDVAEVTYYATTMPAHVNINDLLIMPTAQASATQIVKELI